MGILEALPMNLLKEILTCMDQETSKEAAPAPSQCGPGLKRGMVWYKRLLAGRPGSCLYPPQETLPDVAEDNSMSQNV